MVIGPISTWANSSGRDPKTLASVSVSGWREDGCGAWLIRAPSPALAQSSLCALQQALAHLQQCGAHPST